MYSQNLKLAIHFFQEEPSAAARRMDAMDTDDAAALLAKVPLSIGAKVIKAMLPGSVAPILLELSDEYRSKLFAALELADVAAILRYVELQDRDTLLQLLSSNKQTLCKLLISYPEYTVGSLIETNVLVVDMHMSVEDALLRIKKRNFSDKHPIIVVNAKREMVGQLNAYDLIRTAPASPLSSIMHADSVSISGFTDLSSSLKLDLWLSTDTVAVVNLKQEFIGILRHCDIRLALAKQEAVKDSSHSLSSEILDAYGRTFMTCIELFERTGHSRS
jgi:magnesium transporter